MFSLMLLAAGGSRAMSLGVPQGAALIGRPLDVSVPSTLDPGEDPAGLCLEADVYYAGNKLARSWVQVSADKVGPNGQGFLIHIRSALPVNEPVVSLQLRAGCQQKTERRYVLLADLAPDPGVQTLPQLVTPRQGVSRSGRDGTSGTVAPASGRRSGARALAEPASSVSGDITRSAAPADSLQLRSGRSLGRQGQSADRKRKGGSGARLKLEPLDLTVERDPLLKASGELMTLPSSSAQERSAAAALWRALTAQPEDLLRDAEKLQSLEATVQSQQASAQKGRMLVDDLTAQITRARSERYANGLVYTLVTLLLIALIAVAYLMRRRIVLQGATHDKLPWWRKSEVQEKGWSNSALDAGTHSWDGEAPIDDKSPGNPGVADGPPSGVELDLNLGASRRTGPQAKLVGGRRSTDSVSPPRRDRPDFVLSMTPSRAVKAEELFDVQQQADFFVSLGQHEQAIEVLRNHISDNVQTSALVYLDLFDLYHQLKRREDYEALRKEFNDRFNSKIPAFGLYDEMSPGLEAYQTALTRIEALWPSRKVLEVIEESMFRQPDAGEEAFNLEAYRELLILYAVAREIIGPETHSSAETRKSGYSGATHGDDPKAAKFLATSIQPLSASISSVSLRKQREHAPGAMLPPASPRLALDIDLSQVGSAREVLPSGSESDSRIFAPFAADIPVHPPLSARQAEALGQGDSVTAAEPGNMIDFDLVDTPIKDAILPRPPKV